MRKISILFAILVLFGFCVDAQAQKTSRFIKVSAGWSHASAIRSDGSVWSWGENWGGVLGDGTSAPKYTPVKAKGLSHVTDVHAGYDHTAALCDDGTIWTWGANYYGAIGDGTTESCLYPKQVGGMTGVKAVAVGYYHTMALKDDGTVWTWGDNQEGQLGNGTRISRTLPTLVPGLTGVVAIAAACNHCVVARADGSVYVWGESASGYSGEPGTMNETVPTRILGLTNVVSVSTGYNHSFGIRRDGSVYGWGYNYYGQLGDGTTQSYYSSPVLTMRGAGVKEISAGAYHTAAISGNGSAITCGRNYYGELGDGTDINRANPTFVPGLTDVISISAGDNYTVAATSDGRLWAWGANDSGQLGRGYFTIKTIPEQIAGLSGIASIAAGGSHSCAIATDGKTWTWGSNVDGQLGDGTTINRSIPVQVPDVSSKSIAAGSYHTMLIKTDSTVWGFGYNGYGALGDGTTYYERTTPVRAGTLTNIASVAAGYENTIAAAVDGSVWSWGCNEYGSIGDGTTVDKSYPVRLNGISNVIAVASYSYCTVALKSDGTVWAWGDVSDNYQNFSTTPIQVAGLSGITAISAGSYCLALKSDGTVWAWTSLIRLPTQVAGISDVIAISAGGGHNLAIKRDGTLWSWGSNYNGELGDGTTISNYTPRQVNGLTDVTAIAAGGSHSMARKSDGTVWSWGSYEYGQLGDGRIDFQPTPQLVTPVAIINSSPTLGSVTPYTGSVVTGQWITITCTYSDIDGADDLATCSLLINGSLVNYQGAHFIYDQNSHKFFMKNNASTIFPTAGVTPGTGSIIESQNAIVDTAGSTVSLRGETITIAWRVLFKPIMAKRTCNVYMMVSDDSGAPVYWTTRGRLYLAENATPSLGTVTPNSGSISIGKWLTVTSTYSDSDGASNLASCGLLMNNAIKNAGAAHFFYDQNSNKFFMKNNASTVIPGTGITPGMASLIESENATLDCKESTVTVVGNTITIEWRIRLKPAIAKSSVNMYMTVKDDGEASVPWAKVGAMAVTVNAGPTLGPVAPSSGTIVADTWTTVTSTYSDVDGADSFGKCSLLINNILQNTKGAHFFYDQIQDKFFMKSETGVVIGGINPSVSNIIESENAVLYCMGSRITKNGNTLTIAWRVKLKPVMANKTCNLYVTVVDDSGASVPWVSKGQVFVRNASTLSGSSASVR